MMEGTQPPAPAEPAAPATGEGTVPVFARSGSELPRNSIFKSLREIWLDADKGRTSTQLARQLNAAAVGRSRVLPQHVSQWASGSDGRRPPWWVLIRLAWWCDVRLVLEPATVRIEPIPVEVTNG